MDATSSVLPQRVDDLPLLVGLMAAMNLEALCDAVLPTHGTTRRHNGLTNGQALCVWLVYLLSQGDHRKWPVEAWVAAHADLLRRLWGREVPPSDFTDDRLTTLLAHLAEPARQEALDLALFRQTVTVYELQTTHLRLDATVLTGYHQATPDGLMQFGHAHGQTGGTQAKLMAAATATGRYLTGQVHPGACADDPLYVPLLERLDTWELPADLLLIGDSKMGAGATRRHIVGQQHYYYVPLADGAIPAADWATWIDEAVTGSLVRFTEFAPIWRDETLLGYGYGFTRVQTADGVTWTERVHLIRSLGLVEAERKYLDRQLAKAQAALATLTPPPRPRVKSYPTAAALQAAITAVLQRYQVEGLLTVTIARDADRPSRAAPEGCFRITAVARDDTAYRARVQRGGWRAYVTNAPPARLSLDAGLRAYRQGAGQGIERMNKLLKDHATLGLDRLYVHTPAQIRGLAYFLTLALRVLQYLESTVRTSLATEQTTLPDYTPDGKATAMPTAKTMLARITFRGVTLLDIRGPDGQCQRYLSPLPDILCHLLHHLHLSPRWYTQLLEDPPATPE